ncbi:hypothetical protein HPB50_018725 [Hyalomma asiaticum]|uniref:Uncharacterized protein n=1 Tax=Hyalomma asiaticum TaxID=266040 RepID=A0ACB7RW75_HYAAI|nr:hypothetical protein HPB50_018725 [Hyalomma asiaticum]
MLAELTYQPPPPPESTLEPCCAWHGRSNPMASPMAPPRALDPFSHHNLPAPSAFPSTTQKRGTSTPGAAHSSAGGTSRNPLILEELLRLLRGLRLVFKSSQAHCRGRATGCFGLHIIQPPGITAAGNLRQSNARPKGQSRIPSRSNNYQTTEQPSLLRSAPCPITALVYSTIR